MRWSSRFHEKLVARNELYHDLHGARHLRSREMNSIMVEMSP